MGFKDMVAADCAAVFLNVDEFGVEATVEGKLIRIVVDDDYLKQRQGGQELAVAESGSLFYARAEDLPSRLAPGDSLNINGRERIVDDYREDMGIATVTLHETISV